MLIDTNETWVQIQPGLWLPLLDFSVCTGKTLESCRLISSGTKGNILADVLRQKYRSEPLKTVMPPN